MPTATLSEVRRHVLGPYDRPLLGAATSPDWGSAVGTLAGNDRQGDLGRPVDRSSPQPLLGGAAKSDQGGQTALPPFAVLVMHVRAVRWMAVLLPLMAVRMRMGLACRVVGRILMLVMLVVGHAVMLQRLVHMLVLVMSADLQPDTKGHQQTGR